jgi:hypothetical protein
MVTSKVREDAIYLEETKTRPRHFKKENELANLDKQKS